MDDVPTSTNIQRKVVTEKILALAADNVALDIPLVGNWLWLTFEALTNAYQLSSGNSDHPSSF